MYQATSSQKTLNKEFFKYYGRFYKARFKERISKYDYARDLTNVKTKFKIDEGIKFVINSLKPFGDEYVFVVKKAISENWIDFMPIDNKDNGAYSAGEYGIEKKLILMN